MSTVVSATLPMSNKIKKRFRNRVKIHHRHTNWSRMFAGHWHSWHLIHSYTAIEKQINSHFSATMFWLAWPSSVYDWDFWTLGTPLISRILLCLKVREREIFDQPEYDLLVKDKQVLLALCRLTRKKNQRQPDKTTRSVYQTQNLFASIGGLAV